jgi:hypothetical protein
LDDCFEVFQRPVRIDQIVSIQHDCRIVVMRTDPQIVAGILAEKLTKLTQEFFDGTEGQLWAFVSTPSSAPVRVVCRT